MATSEVGVGSAAAAVSTEEIEAGVEAVGLAEDAGQNLKLDQATLFRCVEDGNISSLSGLLKHRNVDINAYNDEVRIQTNRQADGHSILIDRLLDPPSENGCLLDSSSLLGFFFYTHRIYL